MFHISFLLVYFIVNSFDRKKKTKVDVPKVDFSQFNSTIFEFSWLNLTFFISAGRGRLFFANIDFSRLKSTFSPSACCAPHTRHQLM